MRQRGSRGLECWQNEKTYMAIQRERGNDNTVRTREGGRGRTGGGGRSGGRDAIRTSRPPRDHSSTNDCMHSTLVSLSLVLLECSALVLSRINTRSLLNPSSLQSAFLLPLRLAARFAECVYPCMRVCVCQYRCRCRCRCPVCFGAPAVAATEGKTTSRPPKHLRDPHPRD